MIPTRDRPESLRRCLRALSQSTAGTEVIVVDDGSLDADAVRQPVEDYGAALVRQAASGAGAARNAGVRAAAGDVVCFTDDDCEPEAGWAAALAHALERGADAAAGSTIGVASVWSRGAELVVRHLTERSTIPFAASNNLAARTEVLKALPFSERVAAAAGEDREWCRRFAGQDGAIARVPQAVVLHHHPRTFGEFVRQQLRYGSSAYRFRSDLGHEPPRFYGELLARSFREGVDVGLVVCAAQAATAAGYVLEALRPR